MLIILQRITGSGLSSLQQRLAVELETTLGEPLHFCIPHAYYNKLVE
jgi:hypothetical protein